MATSQQFLVADQSTAANFKGWAKPMSDFIRTAGWINNGDSGQLNGNGNGGWAGVSTVPGSGAYYYEVFKPNDGLATFCLKVEYGNFSGTNSPAVRLTISTTTDGAGTATGLIVGPFVPSGTSWTPASTTATYECDFYGTTNSLAVLMNRTAAINAGGCYIFCIERSLNSSGVATGDYVTMYTIGSNGSGNIAYKQQSLLLASPGAALLLSTSTSVRGNQAAGAFNGTIPVDAVAPFVGYWDQNGTTLASGSAADFTEGVTFSATLYGSSVTYMPTKIQVPFNQFGPVTNSTNYIACVRVS
jgi:hypothetical protein